MIPGVTSYHRREDWQNPNEPITGGRAFNVNNVQLMMAHYSGDDDLPDGDYGEVQDDVAVWLRAVQHSYLTHRGYSLGYSFAVDWLGGVWEIRGYDRTPAANDGDKGEWEDKNLNLHSMAVLYLVDGQDGLTEEAAAAGRAIYRETWKRCPNITHTSAVPHRTTDYTHCPGDGIMRDIAAGRLDFARYTTDPDPEPGRPPMAEWPKLIRQAGKTALFVQYEGGYKTWIPNPEAWAAYRFIHGVGPSDIVDVTPAVLQVAGPVIGPLPPGTDGFGVE